MIERLSTTRTNERGTILVLFTLALTVLLLVASLVVDLGIAHVTSSNLAKAVDAGALAGARHAGKGATAVRDIVERVAAANYGTASDGSSRASYGVEIATPSADTYRIRVTGDAQSPAFFSRVIGKNEVDVAALAEATRYPLDISFVLDVSGSLGNAGVFDDLQEASKNFISNFDDSIDQLGIVAYTTWAWEVLPVRKNFQAVVPSLIDALSSLSWTNIDEGLRIGKEQLDRAPYRENAIKVAVMFTDGRPTAFADNIRMDGPNIDCPSDTGPALLATDSDGDGTPDCYNGVVAGDQTGNSYRGLFTRDAGLRVSGFLHGLPVIGGSSSPTPLRLPGGVRVNGAGVREVGALQAEEWAYQLRAAGYTVYTIGLGNPNASDPLDAPDLDFLRRIANDGGIVNGAQPQGQMLFAPSGADLDATFTRLADRILTRLTL
jgi:Flp pilus assembly protein TadG